MPDSNARKRYYNLFIILLFVFVAFVEYYGVDKIVLGSDELYRARTLLGDDWSITHFRWPAQAIRTRFNNWPMHTPALFVILTRMAVVVFGNAHFALRFWPFLFAVLATIAIYKLYIAYYGKSQAWLSIVMLGLVSDKVLINAKSLKHYTGDLLFCILILLFTKLLLEKNQKRMWIVFTLTVASGIWLAFGVMFTAVSAYVVLFFAYFYGWRKKTLPLKAWLYFFLSAGVFALSVLGLYFVDIRQAVTNSHFLSHVSRSGTQLFDWSRAADVSYLVYYIMRIGYQALKLPVYFFRDSWAWGVVVYGLVLWALVRQVKKRQFAIASLLVLPLIFTVIASFAGVYPFTANRLLLFLAPSYIILSISGFADIFHYFHARKCVLAIGLMAAALLAVGFAAQKNIDRVLRLKFAGGRHVDQAISALMQNARNRDTVYLHWGAILPFWVYATNHRGGYLNSYPLPDHKGAICVIYGDELNDDMFAYEAHFKKLSNVSGRLWVVLAHLYPSPEMELLQHLLEDNRQLLETKEFKGCKVLLYSANRSQNKEPK